MSGSGGTEEFPDGAPTEDGADESLGSQDPTAETDESGDGASGDEDYWDGSYEDENSWVGASGSSRMAGAGNGSPRITVWALILGALVAIVLVVGLVWFIHSLITDASVDVSDTVQQVLWIVFGVMILLIVLLAYSVVNRFTDPESERAALGLPEGSIAAVIALMLIFIFSLTSIFIFTQVRDTESTGRVSTGLTLADVKELPTERVLEVQRNPRTNPATYQVTLTNPSSNSLEIGRTTLATISTLLVAIVGFYFGQRTAATATAQGARLAKDVLDRERGNSNGQRQRGGGPSGGDGNRPHAGGGDGNRPGGGSQSGSGGNRPHGAPSGGSSGHRPQGGGPSGSDAKRPPARPAPRPKR